MGFYPILQVSGQIVNIYLMKQKPQIMKEEYSKPKIGLLELDLEGTLCVSGSNESSAVIDKITIDEEFKW
jgi:hypothetical protein